MVVDQFPLGTSNYVGSGNLRSGGTTGGGIDANVAVSEQDLNYKASSCSRLWFAYYSARQWWNYQRPWVKTTLYLIPIFILLLIILLLSISLGISMNKQNAAVSVCISTECIRSAGRVLAAMNLSADPCVNFYDYACGGFAQMKEIPVGKKMTTQFTRREAIILKQLKNVIEKPLVNDDPVVKKVRTYYQSCLDTVSIELKGLPRLRQMVQDLGGFAFDNATWSPAMMPTQWSFEDTVIKRTRYTMNGIFQIGISPDYFDNSKNVIFLDRGKLGLGVDTRDFYVNKSVTQDPVLVAYTQLLLTYAQLITGTKTIARSSIVDVVTLEQKLAAIHSTQVDRRNVANLYREMKLDALFKNASYIKWDRFLTNMMAVLSPDTKIGLDETLVVLDFPYFSNLTKIINDYTMTQSGIRTLQNYIVLLAVSPYAPRMGSDFKTAYSRFLTIYAGNRGQPEPWLDCLGDTNQKLGFAVGKMYLDRFSPVGHKHRASHIIRDVYESYRQLITGAVWMDEVTRSNALAKFDAMTYDIAFPDWIRNTTYVDQNYINFTITSDYTANLFEYYNHTIRIALKRYGRRPDPTRWGLTPQTVNGQYEATQNKIFIAAGLIQEPFFYIARGIPEALSYGSLGAMTGHEIAHAFDDRGQAFDKNGNIKNWWTYNTLATYRNHTQCFVRQYNTYTIDSGRIDGRQTLGENLADSSGLRSAFIAYKKAQNEGRISGVDAKLPGLDLNSDQLFYLSFAQTYCTLLTKEALRNQITQSNHSPSAVRVVGTLSNLVDFAQTFKCNSVTTMNRKEKCYIW